MDQIQTMCTARIVVQPRFPEVFLVLRLKFIGGSGVVWQCAPWTWWALFAGGGPKGNSESLLTTLPLPQNLPLPRLPLPQRLGPPPWGTPPRPDAPQGGGRRHPGQCRRAAGVAACRLAAFCPAAWPGMAAEVLGFPGGEFFFLLELDYGSGKDW